MMAFKLINQELKKLGPDICDNWYTADEGMVDSIDIFEQNS